MCMSPNDVAYTMYDTIMFRVAGCRHLEYVVMLILVVVCLTSFYDCAVTSDCAVVHGFVGFEMMHSNYTVCVKE